jgi:hypothetical protein
MKTVFDGCVAMLRRLSDECRRFTNRRALHHNQAVQKGFTMAAKKSVSSKPAAKKSPAKGKSTSVRHTPIPQIETSVARPSAPEVTYDMIATRAYLLWQSNGGSEFDNWTTAERELRAA